ncbi:hypothetical protein K438DRAFT_1942819 [Mycena galopus ATCC 62051]|nr:hypothetical protein K438DRAFT_1942819 [Mycena galopus ATCC 62051]
MLQMHAAILVEYFGKAPIGNYGTKKIDRIDEEEEAFKISGGTAVEKYNREMKEWIEWKDAEKVEHKRDLWKAASARYYERHPEVKEKKRLKMAEHAPLKSSPNAAGTLQRSSIVHSVGLMVLGTHPQPIYPHLGVKTLGLRTSLKISQMLI